MVSDGEVWWPTVLSAQEGLPVSEGRALQKHMAELLRFDIPHFSGVYCTGLAKLLRLPTKTTGSNINWAAESFNVAAIRSSES